MAGFGAAPELSDPEAQWLVLARPPSCRTRRAQWLVLRGSGQLEVACNGLAIDPQLGGDSPLGPALTMKRQNEVYHGHSEVIRHGAAPGKEGFP